MAAYNTLGVSPNILSKLKFRSASYESLLHIKRVREEQHTLIMTKEPNVPHKMPVDDERQLIICPMSDGSGITRIYTTDGIHQIIDCPYAEFKPEEMILMEQQDQKEFIDEMNDFKYVYMLEMNTVDNLIKELNEANLKNSQKLAELDLSFNAYREKFEKDIKALDIFVIVLAVWIFLTGIQMVL